MSSSEEYLDNLLKSLIEGDGDELETSLSSAQATESSDVPEASLSGNTSAGEYNKAMSTDDIEAMFASMGQNMTSEETVSDEGGFLDEMVLDDSGLSDELMLDESSLSDELVLDESMLPEETALDEGGLSDELALDESMLPEEMLLDENDLTDELTLDESMLPDEFALDESSLPDELALDESMLPEEMSLDENDLTDELTLDESMFPDEFALDESGLPDELALDESMIPDEVTLDESMLPEESLTEDNTMDEMDELALDESSLSDELALDESMLPEEIASDDFALEESAEEEAGSDDLTLDDLGLDDLGFDTSGQEEADMTDDDGGMSEEDIDRLLGGDLLSGGENDQDADSSDDSDLSALLAGMGDDEDLSEINDLLEKSDRGMDSDDDMLAMLGGVADSGDDDGFNLFGGEEGIEGEPENIREITAEELEERENLKSKKQKKKAEKEKKKREKLAKKAAKKGAGQEEAGEEGVDELNSLLEGMSEAEDKPKKQGFFSRFIEFLLEEDEEEEDQNDNIDDLGDGGPMIGNISEENKALLAELKAEDKMNAKKKEKADKKGKKKKGKKGDEASSEGGEDGADAKPKKQKKEKKKKQKNEEEELKVPEKKLSKKKVTSVFLFCATLAACIVVVTMLLPEQMEKQEARVAFDHAQYEQVYEQLYGRELNEEDEVLLQKSSVILQVKRKLNSYENYIKMDMPLEALNALLEGVNRYHNLWDDAELYRVSSELDEIYGQIIDALSSQYGLSEADALDILGAGDNVTYSQRLRAVIYGDTLGDDDGDMPEVKQDVLPEEEEIIDRLQNTDETEEAESNEIL